MRNICRNWKNIFLKYEITTRCKSHLTFDHRCKRLLFRQIVAPSNKCWKKIAATKNKKSFSNIKLKSAHSLYPVLSVWFVVNKDNGYY